MAKKVDVKKGPTKKQKGYERFINSASAANIEKVNSGSYSGYAISIDIFDEQPMMLLSLPKAICDIEKHGVHVTLEGTNIITFAQAIEKMTTVLAHKVIGEHAEELKGIISNTLENIALRRVETSSTNH